MRFVIEALGLTSGGGKKGMMRLLPALADQGRRHSFVAILADLQDFRALERPNLKLRMQAKPASLIRRHLHLQRAIPGICAREGADALLCLGNFGPLRPALPTVVLLHNAHYVSSGATAGARPALREKLIVVYARRYLRHLPKQTRLVVQTELMKAQVMAAHGLQTSQVTVIRDGDGLVPGQAPAGGATVRNESSRDAARPAPFTFLCMARYYPHKNLEVLLEAMRRLPGYTVGPARCLLTIDSNQHPGSRRLLQRIGSEGMGQAVVNLGPLDGNEVVEAYRSADAFILPSLIESFGRTYLEAIRFGLPILTSDRDFAHEVCRGAALYFDPLDPTSVAGAMARIMSEAALRDCLAAERQRIPIPSWDEVGAQFVDVLEQAATGRNSFAGRCPLPVTSALER